jgi:Tol biopolymer transport system component
VTATTSGSPTPFLDDVYINHLEGNAALEISRDGTLISIPSSEMYPDGWLVRVDRDGREELLLEEPRRFLDPTLSPDGRRLVVTIRDKSEDLWIVDLERDSLSRLTDTPNLEFNGKWTPDGQSILFTMDTPVFDIFQIPADGSGEILPFLQNEFDSTLSEIASDGTVAYWQSTSGSRDLWLTSLEPGSEPRPFFSSPFNDHLASFSPDGRWVAYQSLESGADEVYLQATAGSGGKYQVSVGGGARPLWSPQGDEIFYRLGDKLLGVKVSMNPEPTLGRPVQLFEAPYHVRENHHGYDVDADGRFIFIKGPPGSEPRKMTVILNVQSQLEQLFDQN